MGKLRPKSAAPMTLEFEAGMKKVLQSKGFRYVGPGDGDSQEFANQKGEKVIVDHTGWTAQDANGRDMDFGSDQQDLARYLMLPPDKTPAFDEVQYIHYPPESEEEPGNYFSVVLYSKGKGVFSQLIDEEKIDAVVGPEIAQKMRRGEGEEVRRPNVTGETNPFKMLMVNSEPQTKEWVKDISGINLTDKDKELLKGMGVKSHLLKKKAYGLTNQGEENSVCPKCQQPIAEGQMVNYPAGKETHVQCPPAQAQQPGQQAPGWQSRLNLPPGFKQKQQPAPAPQQQGTPGMISPNVGRPRAGSLLEKKAWDNRFIDDEWRAILEHFGFVPEGQPDTEIWWNQEITVRIKIDNDPEGNAFWVAMQEDGTPLESGSDTDRLQSQLSSVAESIEPKEEIAWEGDVPQFSDADKDFMKDFKIQGKLVAKARKGKTGGRSPHFSFAVPLKAAGAVAFHLAKAGMKDFEVIHFENDDSSVFAFTNEPEMHLGEEIVRAEFHDQITARKGMWGAWQRSKHQDEDPSLVKSEQELHAPTASDKTAGLSVADRQRLEDHIARMTIAGQYKDKHQLAKEILDHVEQAMRGEHGFDSGNAQKFLRGKKFGPQLVESDKTSADSPSSPQYPSIDEEFEEEGRQDRELHEDIQAAGYDEALNRALTALEMLAKIGPSEDIRGCAEMSAGDLRQFAKDQAEGRARKFSSGGDMVYCCVLGHVQMTSKSSAIQKRALDANLVTLIGSFVGAVLVKWLGQEYSKRWGSLAKQAEAKAMQALQNKGVYDLGTLDKYAEQNGVSRIGAFMRLAGQSMLLAAAMTTGIAGAKLLSGEAKSAPAAPATMESQTPTQNQMTVTEEVDEPVQQVQQAPQQTPQELKQQQKQRDQQVMEQIRQQDKDRAPQDVV